MDQNGRFRSVPLYGGANEQILHALRDIGGSKHVEAWVQDARKSGKKIPNVDFYFGIVCSRMGIDPSMFTPIFAVSRVAGWTARVLKYPNKNRIFRPVATYTGDFEKEYVPVERR